MSSEQTRKVKEIKGKKYLLRRIETINNKEEETNITVLLGILSNAVKALDALSSLRHILTELPDRGDIDFRIDKEEKRIQQFFITFHFRYEISESEEALYKLECNNLGQLAFLKAVLDRLNKFNLENLRAILENGFELINNTHGTEPGS